ncbi:MAG: hypothetical protein JXA64_08435 [Candidatus Fermentibacteraceae bacterium]|nr:hypothetical protein [Candidatus Fermentibacteraceae bacterium]MBN2609128.1 hypothetical protein [Candidatus Fermentibacteraceae bacterium]
MRSLGYLLAAGLLAALACTGEPSASAQPGIEIGVITDCLPSPGETVTGLAFGGGWLWAVDSSTRTVFRMDPATGEVDGSFPCSLPNSYRTTGLAYSSENAMILVGLWDYGYNGYVYQYSLSGELIGSMSMCGG